MALINKITVKIKKDNLLKLFKEALYIIFILYIEYY